MVPPLIVTVGPVEVSLDTVVVGKGSTAGRTTIVDVYYPYTTTALDKDSV
jgi:hypothetical protein